jgi:hypothetical protein
MSNIDSLIVQANISLLVIKRSANIVPPNLIVKTNTAKQINVLISTAESIRNTYIKHLASIGVPKKKMASMFGLSQRSINQILANDSGGKNGK